MIGQLENSILEKYKMLLKDEEFIQTLYKYTISFPKHCKIILIHSYCESIRRSS